MVERVNASGFRESRMPPEAMEVIADVLLAASGTRDDRPAYSEDQLARKTRRVARAEEHFELMSADALHSEMPEMDDPIAHAGLTHDEAAAWKMYDEGYIASEISRAMGVTRPTTVRMLKSAARKLLACRFKYSGLRSIYYHETHQHTYRPPVHCSEQPCKRLGYCRYALRRPETVH